MDDIVRQFTRKTRLGFKVGADNTSLVQTRGDTRVADKLLPAIENVMADVVKTIEEAAVGIGGAIDITKVNMQSFSFWSKRMGSDAASKMDMFKQFISEYANRVAATISGLPDAKDWRFADFDELLRLVGSLQTVNEAFRTFGKEIKLLDSTLTGANIAGGLVDLVGGAEAFKDAMELYGDVVLTESERSAGALYNSGENVKTAVDRMNEVLRQGGMSEFQMDTDMSQSEFKAAFETFSNLLGNAEYGDIAQTMIAGLLEALPQYEIQWEELNNLAEKEREYADLRADLLEEQGRSYEALSLRREWEIAELERIGDTEGARISALIHKEQDLNATRELELQILELSGRSQESLAIQRERELLGLKESDRVLQQRIWDLELENQAIDINLQIMKLSGQSMEALAIERQRELSTMDASLRPLQERLWALELEQQATDLNLQVMELSGQSMEALAITRQQELLSMDESLRPLQERVWALELEQEASDLNLQAMELSGRSMEALAITREQELLSMDESLRPLQERVWALELEQQATDLGIQAMELSGRSMEALAIQRQQELSQMDESLRPLQERVWALELEQQATDLNIQIMQLSGRSMEALAIQRQQELSQMDESLRPLQERVWALEVEEQASKLNMKIMQLSGRSMEALAIQRELELSQMDESLRPLQERVWALETEQQAQKITLKIMKLSGQSMEALAIQRELELSQMDESLRPLQERLWALELEQKATKLNLQIMKLSGQSMEALAIEREIELSKMDESLRPLQERVWALELEEDAQKLNLKAMKLSGQSMEALAIERQIELSKMDESLRPLQERVWALELEEDAQKLTLDIMRLSGRSMEALNIERQKELSLMDESLRPLQEAVWALELRNATIDAELELMRLTGMSIQALAIQREKELSAVDESMHAVKRATWEMQDAGEALSAAFAKRTEDYNTNFEAVAQTYTDQITKTEESVSSLSSAVDSLTSFAQSQETVTRGVILRTIMQVRALTAEVKEGQYGGLENLSGYLSILGTDNKNLYGTFVDFRRDQTIASNALRDLEGAATVQLSTEELMLQTLNEQLEAETKHRDAQIQQWEEELNALLGINTSVMTVESAMTRFLLAQEAAANVLNGGVIATGVTDGTVMPDLSTTDLNLSTGADAAYSGTNTVETKLDTSQLEQELVKLREELSAANFQIAKNTSNTTRLLERWDGDGMPETRVIV